MGAVWAILGAWGGGGERKRLLAAGMRAPDAIAKAGGYLRIAIPTQDDAMLTIHRPSGREGIA